MDGMKMEQIQEALTGLNNFLGKGTIFGILIGILVSSYLKKRSDWDLKLAEQKSVCYSQYIEKLVNLNKEANESFFYAKTQVIQYGSKEVLEKLAVVEYEGITNLNNEYQQKVLSDLIIEMKKDVAKPNRKTADSTVLREQIYKILNLKKKR